MLECAEAEAGLSPPPLLLPPAEVEAELARERQRAEAEAERARQAIRDKEQELLDLEERRQLEVW